MFVRFVWNVILIWFQTPRGFGAKQWILRGTGKELYNTHKTGNVPEKTGTNGIPIRVYGTCDDPNNKVKYKFITHPKLSFNITDLDNVTQSFLFGVLPPDTAKACP
jgi:hypothetical protein